MISFLPLQIKQYVDMRRELSKTNEDIEALTTRQNVIQQYPQEQLEDLVITLNSLYPSVEDRFSIFTALDNIQAVSGVGVISYSSPFAGKTLNEITIAVKSRSDLTSFRRFLQVHVFRSGRFMTIDKIVFDNENGALNFTGKFYSKNVELGSQTATQYSPEAITRLQEIKREVEGSGLVRKDLSKEEEAIPTDYSTKSNPFE
jgi:hypothetical protein